MLRALSCVYIEKQVLRRKDVLKVLCAHVHSRVKPETTVLTHDVGGPATSAPPPPAPPPPPAAPPPPPPRRSYAILTALTFAASVGGVYLYRRMKPEPLEETVTETRGERAVTDEAAPEPVPALAEQLPAHAQYLVVGGGTAAFAAMRAIRSARPDAQVLLVSAEHALPYMRPPLSKELWREEELAARAAHPDSLTFAQWNGRRRSVLYEPGAFYTSAERLREAGAGAGVARGWRVTRVDAERRRADLEDAAGGQRASVTFDKCLLAPGVRARRLPQLRAAAAAGRSFAVRELRDVARLARALDDPRVRTVAVVGGGLLATELAAALADRLRSRGVRVALLYRERRPLEHVLPPYLAADAGRRLQELGVALLPDTELTGCRLEHGALRLATSGPGELRADVLVECVGSELDEGLARASRLETHPALGGLLVNAELQARDGVWAAGDAACFYDELLGRRRVEHHDHAVLSGRLAGENMAAAAPARAYRHQSMFWSDLGTRLGYEAIGIIDSSLQTVGVFCEDAVSDVKVEVAAGATAKTPAESQEMIEVEGSARPEAAWTESTAEPQDKLEVEGSAMAAGSGERYERGVVFYLRERRVVGVLLWNLFNRMHVARQVLSQGEFEDLFEVAKLFSLHEED
ncbi:apoptosis-inducing factor 1, mitochondrial-like [Leptidea sinapis]|uniref:apoptosis-inducing factor 1, mitochondrial-like n=1 Tax=Leptidea sinapis TaxID=189913 RepID=UPI002131821D|nr:apoptosis-inducing factor 1, mitochondrial-like [Leptidea sinapis]